MPSLINNWDIESSFWEINPQLKLYFREEYEADKSKNKLKSSATFWILALVLDVDSKFVNLPIGDRITVICDNLKVSTSEVQEILSKFKDKYLNLAESTVDRMLRIWKVKLDEKVSFLENTNYDETTWEMLDKMQLNFVNAYKQYEQIKKELEKESQKTEATGVAGREKSLSEKRVI